ncbi:Ctr copper transporter [Aspergillus filifer]
MDHTSMTTPMTFDSSIKVTLFFESWTTASVWAYLLALFLLFTLAFFNRFLDALRFQLEHSAQSTDHITVLVPPKRKHVSKARLSPHPRYIQIDDDEIESETRRQDESDHGSINDERGRLVPEARRKQISTVYSYPLRRLSSHLPTWTPNAPWDWRRDGSRALLEGVRALIAYILMLAVMTLNVGVFCAVLGGIIFGEVVLGRYMRVSRERRDGACHE